MADRSAQKPAGRFPFEQVHTCKIHPGIGIARVGNSPDQYFIGPRRPLTCASSRPLTAATRTPTAASSARPRASGFMLTTRKGRISASSRFWARTPKARRSSGRFISRTGRVAGTSFTPGSLRPREFAIRMFRCLRIRSRTRVKCWSSIRAPRAIDGKGGAVGSDRRVCASTQGHSAKRRSRLASCRSIARGGCLCSADGASPARPRRAIRSAPIPAGWITGPTTTSGMTTFPTAR